MICLRRPERGVPEVARITMCGAPCAGRPTANSNIEWRRRRAVLGESTAWAQHPAARMWVGYGQALLAYSVAVCEEALHRGMADSLLPWFRARQHGPVVLPPWLGDERLHAAHRSQLISKLPEWYRPLFPSTPDGLPRVYPVPLLSKRPGVVFLGDLPPVAFTA